MSFFQDLEALHSVNSSQYCADFYLSIGIQVDDDLMEDFLLLSEENRPSVLDSILDPVSVESTLIVVVGLKGIWEFWLNTTGERGCSGPNIKNTILFQC